MRILLLADIHSNWPALSAIREPFDACLVLGDIVDYGPQPQPCIEWVRRHATACIRGNHDHAVAQRVPARGGSGLRAIAAALRPCHWQQLSTNELSYLARLPVTQRLTLDEKQFYLVHATPRDPLDEYLTDDNAAWLRRLEGIEADFVCVGHSHQPFHLDLGRTQVINPGSVGQPRDGDPRVAYAIIEDGTVTHHRLAYDVEATVAALADLQMDEEAFDLAATLLRTGGRESAGTGSLHNH